MPDLDAVWRLPGESLRGLRPPFEGGASKPAVVAALLDDRRNIHASALILALYQRQWAAANPAWSIRHRPDVLATLYQIGFERSRPHGQPLSNRFGDRVLMAAHLPWLADAIAIRVTPAGRDLQ